jgi:hypothetical protein
MSVLYTPAADTLGTDTFTYTLSDGSLQADPVTVTVNVVEFVPGSISGFVYIDTNNNGLREVGEEAFDGVTIDLTGTDDFGGSVTLQATTDATGAYRFNDLPPGVYTVTETQPTGSRNGVPIVDGKDTIGSQGGTVPANDTFAITLAEGVHGTDNNFAELLGRSISGRVQASSNAVFGNVTIKAFAKGADGVRIGEAARLVIADGFNVTFAGLPAGDYEVVPDSNVFLIDTVNGTTASINDADSVGNQFALRGRQAAHISLRDISNRAAQAAGSGQFIQVAANAEGSGWFAMGSHYTDQFSDGRFTLTDGGAMLHIELTTTGGEMQMADIPMTDSRVRHISQEAGFQLIEIDVASDALGLQAMAAANAEGESAAAPGDIAGGMATGQSNVAAEGEGDSHAADTHSSHDHDHDHQTFSAVALQQPVLGHPEPTDATNHLTAATTTLDVLSNNVTLGVISTAALTPTVPLLSTSNTPTASESADLVESGLRGEILDELADENQYADPALFVVAHNSDGDDDDFDLVDRAVEELTDELLDVLALGAIA